MVTATASTYLGGGDLSWQAINWSTPDALDLWFRLAGADYALKTEQDAAQVLQHSAFPNNIASHAGGDADVRAVHDGGRRRLRGGVRELGPAGEHDLHGPGPVRVPARADVGRVHAVHERRRQSGVGPLNVVVSRGMDAGVIVVGDSDGLLVAETAGAPVELRVVEPAIGGVEVGIIGAFEAVVVDDGAFAMLTTAS